MKPTKHDDVHKLSLAGLLISLGIVFGDIGTSPLYVFKAVFHQGTIDRDLIIGSLSCVFLDINVTNNS